MRFPRLEKRALEIALRLREADSRALDAGTIGIGFLNVLRELGKAGPLVVAVDDFQWIDTQTAAVLEFAGRRLRGEPVLFLASLRMERQRGGAPFKSHAHSRSASCRSWSSSPSMARRFTT